MLRLLVERLIFMRKSYVQINGKLVPKNEATFKADGGLTVMGDIEPFKSPITGETIRGRAHLRQHMKEHGVTHSGDYSQEWYEKRRKEIVRQQERDGRAHRIELLKKHMGIL